jgi:hypothetical protein
MNRRTSLQIAAGAGGGGGVQLQIQDVSSDLDE